MAVGADAEHLDVDAAGCFDLRLIRRAVRRNILCQAIGYMRVGQIQIQVVEELFFHEPAVGLRMVGGEPVVLIEVEGAHPAEVESVTVGLDQRLVKERGRAAGGEAEHGLRAFAHGFSNHISSPQAGRFGGRANNDVHTMSFALQIQNTVKLRKKGNAPVPVLSNDHREKGIARGMS